jgi:hypothetical protein
MRVAALAYVHGNAVALAEVDREQPDVLVWCGDRTGERLPLGMPNFERIEELMRTPPPPAEVIEHGERVVFAS